MTGGSVPTEVDQIEPDGTIVTGFDPVHVPFEDQENIMRTALQSRGWSVTFQQADKPSRRRLLQITKGNVSFQVITYIFPNLSWSNGGRNNNEKRIQITRDYNEHKSDFILAKDGDPRCALMGIYQRNGLIIFCAWDSATYEVHANPTSCYVRANAMASAARSGLGQSIDSKKRLVCCFTPDLLAYYFENMAFLHENVVISDSLIAPADEQQDSEASTESQKKAVPPQISQNVPDDLPHNRLLYGAPGTGKSHKLADDVDKYFLDEFFYERATFFPDTTNGLFVGEYKPVPTYRRVSQKMVAADRITEVEGLEPIIDYRFEPGPFLRVFVKSYHNPEFKFALLIEEINRAHASAVFGEVFQLLDRDENGVGKYTVTLSPAAQDYLSSQGIKGAIKIPSNMYIWATMNSADQGVFPMDAAFRRRWSLEYIGINENESAIVNWKMKLRFLTGPIEWNEFRKKINSHLQRQGIVEDRLLGPFFMTEKELQSDVSFENKILQYLRDDVVRGSPGKLFVGETLNYGALVASYRDNKNIFHPEVGISD